MKTRILISMLLFFCIAGFAQDGKLLRQKKEELKAVKVAFITDALDLTPAEAQKFWPIYNQFENDQFQLRQKKMETSLRDMTNEKVNDMSEKESQSLLGQIEESEAQLYQLKKKLVTDLKPVLSAKKIILLKKAEEDFNRKLLKQYKNRRK